MQQVVVITGGTKGIGLELVRRFNKQGCKVFTCSRNETLWQTLLKESPELKSVSYESVDITNQEQLSRFFNNINGQIDIAVNNASPDIAAEGDFTELDISALRNTIDNDLWGPILCLKHLMPLMSSGGRIVNVSSINGLGTAPGASVYAAAKHGLEGLTKSLALEAIKQGVRINSVAPGVTWTPRWEEKEEKSPGLREVISKKVPAGRVALAGEIADAVEWLVSDRAGYVVGHTLVVDGGLGLV